MRTICFGKVAVALTAALAATSTALAQEPSLLLSRLQLAQHISSAEPADHMRLRDHFTALADRYAADATRHTAMAAAYIGNPNRPAAGLAAHCRRLAELAAGSAATVRELAAHHGRLAEGTPSVAPENAARFEAGEGARAPTDKELREAAAHARTPADHRALEEYFGMLAARHTAEANDHLAMARSYRAAPNRLGGYPALHCDRLVKLSRKAADEATHAAAEHARWASIG